MDSLLLNDGWWVYEAVHQAGEDQDQRKQKRNGESMKPKFVNLNGGAKLTYLDTTGRERVVTFSMNINRLTQVKRFLILMYQSINKIFGTSYRVMK